MRLQRAESASPRRCTGALGVDAVEDQLVLARERERRTTVDDLFAEDRRVRVQTASVQGAENAYAVVDRLTGDEPGRTEPEPIPIYERPQSAAIGGAEDQRAQEAIEPVREHAGIFALLLDGCGRELASAADAAWIEAQAFRDFGARWDPRVAPGRPGCGKAEANLN
jgi:hypothetical protein